MNPFALRATTVAAINLFLASGSGPAVVEERSWNGGSCSAEEMSHEDLQFEWKEQSPLEFLEVLRSMNQEMPDRTHVTLWCTRHNWIRLEHIEPLLKQIYSATPCIGVTSSISSILPDSSSTVGQEAKYLIEGFRKGEYPPGLLSELHESEAEDLIEWWKNQTGEK